ncbi:ACP S-malonyltransferase [Pseudoclavibacter sp. CFCC 11306]|uniref:ACP S-malonyltransferase n=1 Tax=Pseudoclavibacter sp. CFCC 11306 TaxID=1564493 RepID=UPI0013014C22|nr:ACP S-malonyltransferase [Pseudoclavibacter sp. CFCC 11306]KAB1658398.1 ACP S-malonyltransferase [Pseudoclavibacter sp. CFCC 11306]
MILLACPGQGSQKPGFLTPWLERPELRELAEQLSTATGIDLVEAGTVSDADTIRDTAIAQPLIVAAGLISAQALTAELSARGVDSAPFGYAGHSVGEITAAALAGVFTAETAARFVRERSQAMAQAAAATPTTMAAVIGGDRTEVLARLDALGLTAANFNSAAQLVAAGAVDAVAKLVEEPPARARVIPLSVAGAFHTTYMQPAREHLLGLRDTFGTSDPTGPLWTNADGTVVPDGQRYLDLLISQVASPVHWDADQASFVEHGVTAMVELLPGGTLVGLAKRELRGLPSKAIVTPDDLAPAADLIADHLDD